MKLKKTWFALAAGAFIAAQGFTVTAHAAPVTLSGHSVDFSFDDALLGLFGPASVSGDTLFFTPVNFKAQAFNGAGFALTASTMNIRVTARAPWQFAAMHLQERGDYLLLGNGSFADVGGQMRIFDTASPLVDLTASILPAAPLTLAGLPTRNWQATAGIGLTGMPNARTLNVTVENLLIAASTGPGLAFVEKKFVGLTPTVTPVPEPEGWALMLAGLGLLGFVARRRIKTH